MQKLMAVREDCAGSSLHEVKNLDLRTVAHPHGAAGYVRGSGHVFSLHLDHSLAISALIVTFFSNMPHYHYPMSHQRTICC